MYSYEFPNGTSWKSADPPFPPVELAPLADRFVRLHGAAVSDRAGRAVVILGESGFGKTTLSSELCLEHGYRLLADEDVFIHRRGSVVEPFVNGDGPWVDGSKAARSLWTKHPDLISNIPAAVSSVGALRPSNSGVQTPREMDSPALLRALLDSQRPGGVTHEEGIATLARLARSATGFELPGERYGDIRGAAGQVAALVT
ncbi:hypothetical protein [Amycolatopsis cihanbeyliensis]|uniref:hypothetical protein n=1 Tax=Amycolatopsis cihanbeyliensis TaxID=1128664 RepID=UPI001150FA45|nr:hypothetical protein [Amycolatopsis cihanbeyliensis]